MKTLLYTIIILGWTFSFPAQVPMSDPNRQQNDKNAPPTEVLENFKKEYPSVTPAWTKEGENYKAVFVDPNTLKGISIVYDKTGNVIRREGEAENASYPEGINTYYIEKYPGEKFKTWVSTDPSGTRKYFISRGNETLWFDSEGHYVKPYIVLNRPSGK